MNDIEKWAALIIAITGFISSGITVLVVKLIGARSEANKQEKESDALLLEARARAGAAEASGEATLIAAKAQAEKDDAEEDAIRENSANQTFAYLAEQCKQRVDHLEEMLQNRYCEEERLRSESNRQIQALQEQVASLSSAVINLRAENKRLRSSVRTLIQQLSRAGIRPEVVLEDISEGLDAETLPPPATKRWHKL